MSVRGSSSNHHRLYDLAKNKLLRQEEISRLIPDKECSFKPKINENSYSMIENRKKRGSYD